MCLFVLQDGDIHGYARCKQMTVHQYRCNCIEKEEAERLVYHASFSRIYRQSIVPVITACNSFPKFSSKQALVQVHLMYIGTTCTLVLVLSTISTMCSTFF